MAEIKDKVVTVESLAAVHTHGQNTYMTQVNPSGSGKFSIDGDGDFSGGIYANTLVMGNTILRYDSAEGALKVSFVVDEDERNENEIEEEIVE